MNNIVKELSLYGIVPVVKIERIEDALPLAKALCEGGLPIAEVTFRTECAKEAIKVMKNAYPEMIVGAGTVLNANQVDEAMEAGSQFIVSPGLNPKTVQYCLDKNIPILPGCASPSDMERAIELGLDTVKFFPAEANGGIKAIKAMSAPYGNLHFMPTGGINTNNLNDYLSFDKILACGGTWMVSQDLIDNQQWDKITEITKEAIKTMLDIQVHHIAIGCHDQGQELLSLVHNPTYKQYPSSIISNHIEFMFDENEQQLNHISLSTKSIERAMFFLQKLGYSFNKKTIQYNEKNKIKFVYFNELVSGCRCHLCLED